MQIDPSVRAIANTLDIFEKCACELRVRIQKALNEVTFEDREGKFRCTVVVQRGTQAMYQDDTTATAAIQNASLGDRVQADRQAV